ncbi:MAG: ABC-type lipoprotein export system ATPase subunit [Verrucomicrobiales bacterium]
MKSVLQDSAALAAREVHRVYHVGKQDIHVLRGVSMEVMTGEILFLCGASGAGKTTLLYTVAGLEEPNQGSVMIRGHSLYGSSKKLQAQIRNEMMGYIFQNYYLLPELTALENVLLPALIAKEDAHDDAVELLKRVGLSHRMDHLPTELSGGEQQRVAIARALINDPDIIFADEPTGNLDSKAGQAVMELLLGLAREEGKTLAIVTHDARLASLGDRTLYLSDGLLAV